MADNHVARIKQLDQERAQLLSSAKKEALERVSEALSELNSLGFTYQLVEKDRRAGTRRGTGAIKDAECPVCKFKTSPPHDARKHRGQGKRKKPFTQAELKELAIARV